MVSNKGFEEFIRVREDYWPALGKFLDVFATVESCMQMVLWHYAKTPTHIARAIFSGVRIKEAISFVNRILEVSTVTPEAKADLAYVFAQLTVITNVRNQIIHHGALPLAGSYDHLVVTNALMALTDSRVTSMSVTGPIIDDLTSDLWKVQAHLSARHFGNKILGDDGLPESFSPEEREALKAAWHYKPPAQAKHPKKTREKTPKR